MSERQETIADIVAELRQDYKGRPPMDRAETTWCRRRMADRIEAAQKREVGNGAKMREALLEVTRQLEPIVKYMHPNKAEHIGLTTVFAACEPIYKIAKAALAEPARVCDVLSANELKLQVFAGLAYQIKIKGFNIRGLEELLKSVAGAVIDIAYDTNEEGKTND